MYNNIYTPRNITIIIIIIIIILIIIGQFSAHIKNEYRTLCYRRIKSFHNYYNVSRGKNHEEMGFTPFAFSSNSVMKLCRRGICQLLFINRK